jgi:hypothetical protein
MTTRIFAERNTFKLVGDARGFTVPVKHRAEYWDWCHDNDIKTEFQGSMSGVDLWYVKNDEHRMLALLRWS